MKNKNKQKIYPLKGGERIVDRKYIGPVFGDFYNNIVKPIFSFFDSLFFRFKSWFSTSWILTSILYYYTFTYGRILKLGVTISDQVIKTLGKVAGVVTTNIMNAINENKKNPLNSFSLPTNFATNLPTNLKVK